MRPLLSVIRLYFSNLKSKFTNILGEENKLIKIKTFLEGTTVVLQNVSLAII